MEDIDDNRPVGTNYLDVLLNLQPSDSVVGIVLAWRTV